MRCFIFVISFISSSNFEERRYYYLLDMHSGVFFHFLMPVLHSVFVILGVEQ